MPFPLSDQQNFKILITPSSVMGTWESKVSYTTSGSVSLGQLLGMQLDFSFQKCFPGL